MILTERLSELIGAIIGNGNIYSKKPCYVEIAGDPALDQSYFRLRLTKIIESELAYRPKIRLHSGALRLRINNKTFVLFLKKLGIPSGKCKTKTVVIPDIILESCATTKRCIRGIFDTDGSVYFDRRNIYKKPYPRIELHLANEKLINQIYFILKKFGLNCRTSRRSDNSFSIYLNGASNVIKFLNDICLVNERHINRIEESYPELLCRDGSAGRAADFS
jgi:intein/homing endonuclease